MQPLPYDTSLFPRELTAREEADRLEAVEAEASRYFDSATRAQRTAFTNVTASSALMHGHGSQAHTATVDLAHREWDATTAEARELYEATVECLLTEGEISSELDDAWTALSDREKRNTDKILTELRRVRDDLCNRREYAEAERVNELVKARKAELDRAA